MNAKDYALLSVYHANMEVKRATCNHLWQCSEDGYTCVRCKAVREPFCDYPPDMEPSDEELAWLEALEEPQGHYDESTNPSNGWRYPGD